MAETIGTAKIIIIADGDAVELQIRRSLSKASGTVKKGAQKAGDDWNSTLDDKMEKGWRARLARLRASMGLHAKEMMKIGDRTGRIFGKGSRNDFLNLIGSMVGGIAKAIPSLLQWASGIEKAGSASADAAKQMESAGGSVSRLTQALGIVGQIATVAGIVSAVTTMLGALGAAASLTTGLVLALAGSLGFALVGGLAAVGGALVPFAAGIGVAALALGGLQKMSKTAPFKQLKKDFVDLQKDVAKDIFGKQGEGLKNLSGILKTIRPLITPVAKALGGLLKSFGEFSQTRGFGDMMSDLGKALGPMVTQIGQIGGKLAVGLGQAFLAAEPLVSRFLDWVEQIADAFIKVGEGGKKSDLAGFFTRAGKTLTIVWDLVKNVGKSLITLFDAGKNTGDSVLQGLADAAGELATWLADNPDALQNWFDDAGKLAGKLGEVVDAVIKFIDTLDSDTSREFLFFLLDSFVRLINLVTWLAGVLEPVQRLFLAIGQAVVAMGSQIGPFFLGIWAGIKQGAGETWTVLQGWGASIAAFFSGVFAWITTTVSAAWASLTQRASEAKAGVLGAWSSVVGFFQRIGAAITAGWGGATGSLRQRAMEARNGIVSAFQSIKGKIAAVPGQIAAAFTGLAGKVIAKAGSIASRFAGWVSSLAGKARSTAAGVISAFSNLAGRMIARGGSILGKFGSWVAGLPGKARSIAQQIANAFSGLASKAMAKAGSIVAAIGHWASGVYGRARGVANDIVRAFSGLASRIVNAIGTIIPRIKMPSIPRPHITAIVDKGKARGDVVTGPTYALIGEAGPEAVVPLNRSLSQVDPSVRMLSAIAQGKIPALANGGVGGAGKTIDVGGITINTPTSDPRAVASEVINHMAAASYI